MRYKRKFIIKYYALTLDPFYDLDLIPILMLVLISMRFTFGTKMDASSFSVKNFQAILIGPV